MDKLYPANTDEMTYSPEESGSYKMLSPGISPQSVLLTYQSLLDSDGVRVVIGEEDICYNDTQPLCNEVSGLEDKGGVYVHYNDLWTLFFDVDAARSSANMMKCVFDLSINDGYEPRVISGQEGVIVTTYNPNDPAAETTKSPMLFGFTAELDETFPDCEL